MPCKEQVFEPAFFMAGAAALLPPSGCFYPGGVTEIRRGFRAQRDTPGSFILRVEQLNAPVSK
jgi:hypothetical protein